LGWGGGGWPVDVIGFGVSDRCGGLSNSRFFSGLWGFDLDRLGRRGLSDSRFFSSLWGLDLDWLWGLDLDRLGCWGLSDSRFFSSLRGLDLDRLWGLDLDRLGRRGLSDSRFSSSLWGFDLDWLVGLDLNRFADIKIFWLPLPSDIHSTGFGIHRRTLRFQTQTHSAQIQNCALNNLEFHFFFQTNSKA
jgi:hypothetical protein